MVTVTGKRGVYTRKILSIKYAKLSEECQGYVIVYEEPYKKIYTTEIPEKCVKSVKCRIIRSEKNNSSKNHEENFSNMEFRRDADGNFKEVEITLTEEMATNLT